MKYVNLYFSQNINYQPVIIVDETRLFPENVCRVEKDYWKIWIFL